MCGIFGYRWNGNVSEILQHGLERLEYRGYDSAGIFVMDKLGDSKFVKSVWKVSNLASKIKNEISKENDFCAWIAHTRRATHWKPTIENTHPHFDSEKKFFVVHNWIIENYAKIKKELQNEGYKFYSETDTEVIAVLMSKYWNGDLLETVESILEIINWAYALAICTVENPNEMVAVKWGSPLIFGTNLKNTEKEFFISSDIQALSWYANEVIELQDWDLVCISGDDYIIKSEWNIVEKKKKKLETQDLSNSKWEYETFMLKEIFEQPAIISRSFKWRINFETGDIYSNSLDFIKDMEIEKIVFVWCGTSYNAGKVWAERIRDLVWIDASVEIASEYIYKRIPTDSKTLHVFLSQSGETADSIEVLKYIKQKKGKTMWIVNVVWSSIANLTDCGFFLRAWFEIGVASTKAFSAQMVCLMFLALYLGKKNHLDYLEFNKILSELKKIPELMQEILEQKDEIQKIAIELTEFENMFFLGRKYQAYIADEGSLKMKEITYIHTESYPAGELKHWPLALIQENFPTIFLAPDDFLLEQNLSSISEIQARWWKILVVGNTEIPNIDWFIKIPSLNEILMPFLTCAVMQLLSYYVAKWLWRNIDKPRNLAKSVTVK